MRVHIPRLRTSPWSDLVVDDLERLAAADRFHVHELVEEPAAADVVLFPQCHMADWRLKAIRQHPAARRHWKKVMVYDERDRPWASHPGIYVSCPRARFDPSRQQAWGYLRARFPSAEQPVRVEPDLLFSFIGSPTAPCRKQLFELRHPDAVVEEVRGFMFWDSTSDNFEARRIRFDEILARSRFVLCPRGHGTSSFRLYETMATGRVPVIISDDWVAPTGPDWDSFSLRVSERETSSLVDLLEERNADWPELSVAAAIAFEEYFGEQVAFHRVVELLAALRTNGASTSAPWLVEARAARAALGESRLGRGWRVATRLTERELGRPRLPQDRVASQSARE